MFTVTHAKEPAVRQIDEITFKGDKCSGVAYLRRSGTSFECNTGTREGVYRQSFKAAELRELAQALNRAADNLDGLAE